MPPPAPRTPFTIRLETPADYRAVYEVNRVAFEQKQEADLVEQLRQAPGHIPELSLVASAGTQVVGHVLFSPVAIQTAEKTVPALALAPIAVLPAYQRRGVGSQLIRVGLESARHLGHRSVIVLGHPDFYARFGFVPASAKDIRCPFPAPDEAFMVCELVAGALAGVYGTVQYPAAFFDV